MIEATLTMHLNIPATKSKAEINYVSELKGDELKAYVRRLMWNHYLDDIKVSEEDYNHELEECC